MVETKNNDRLKRECGNKKAEAATSARKLLMTINDHRINTIIVSFIIQ